ncbi:dihydropteroate synthase [Nisaea acidiphila]|uniref:Dihydropteroate synthase n=1 Tax=Nisaea acidiphila TaxID=1862145 RepID=A0A9J7AR07_9PROT|nr:dihydropteroate synthase [Nisaea acidiphila]UUX48780.1 dihydropteroate synthase [Nisaea acidiphila]
MVQIIREAALRRGLLPSGARIRLRPEGILWGESAARLIGAGAARPLAGGPGAFTSVELIARSDEAIHLIGPVPVADAEDWAEEEGFGDVVVQELAALIAFRPALCGLPQDRPLVMGIVNVTPDSFSDGGDFADRDVAVDHAFELLMQGADILDIGGESTRPGADPVPVAEELRRVVPVIEGIRSRAGAKRPVISVDTRRPAVMRAALDAGADIVNDVTGLKDPESRRIVAEAGVPAMLMHMRGEPQSMQTEAVYDFSPLEMVEELERRVLDAERDGIARGRIIADPGVGFAKNVTHNLEVLARLGLLHSLGCPILLGVSRKRFIGALSRDEPAKQRVPGSLAAALAGVEKGVQMVRVHDVAETVQALKIWAGIAGER